MIHSYSSYSSKSIAQCFFLAFFDKVTWVASVKCFNLMLNKPWVFKFNCLSKVNALNSGKMMGSKVEASIQWILNERCTDCVCTGLITTKTTLFLYINRPNYSASYYKSPTEYWLKYNKTFNWSQTLLQIKIKQHS